MSNKLNYTKLISLNPTKYDELTNSLGQLIELFEHPILGEDAEVICVCRALELASYSGFHDCDDMMAQEDYEPLFVNGDLKCKFETE